MIRSKGEAGTGDVSEAVRHLRTIRAEMARLSSMSPDELYVAAKELQAPYDLVAEVARTGELPVVLCRWGSGHARRCRPGYADGRPGRLRGFGHLQVR